MARYKIRIIVECEHCSSAASTSATLSSEGHVDLDFPDRWCAVVRSGA
jgi:hypothetical protein